MPMFNDRGEPMGYDYQRPARIGVEVPARQITTRQPEPLSSADTARIREAVKNIQPQKMNCSDL